MNIPFLAGVPFICLLLVVTGCGKSPAPDTVSVQGREPVLARIGSREITAAEFLAEIALRQGAGLADKSREQILQDMIQREALLQQARQSGIEQDPQVRRAMSNLLIGKYIDKELRPRLEEVAVTPDEVRVAYESNLVRYTRSAQVRFSMLKLELGPKSSEERRREVCKRLDEARQKVLANPSKGTGLVNKGFGAYSVDYSDDQLSRYRGGDIGWIDESHIPSHLPKNIMEAGMALALGQVSDVIMADDGAYLLIKTDRRDASVKPFADIEAGLRQHLIAQKRQMMESSFKEQAVRRLAPMIDEKSLSALVLPERQGSNDVNKVRLPALPSAGISGQNK